MKREKQAPRGRAMRPSRKGGTTPAKRRITLDIDAGMLSGVDELAGSVNESRNTFIVSAVARRLRQIRREQTDAAFERMASDPEAARETMAVERDWAPASDAAWRILDDQERLLESEADRPAARPRRVRRASR